MFDGPKRTPAQWVEYLKQEHTPVTILEFVAGCLSRSLAQHVETAQAGAHAEKILERMELQAMRRDPTYSLSDSEYQRYLDEQQRERLAIARANLLQSAEEAKPGG